MSRRLITAMAFLATAASPLFGQAPPTQALKGTDLADARIAAARYAVANGIDLPAGDVAVGFEMGFERIGFARHLTATEELQSQAKAIATAIGRGARPGSAAQLLTCRQRACAPNSKTSVLLIEEPTTDEKSVTSLSVRLFSPSDSGEFDALLTHGVLEVEQKGGTWAAVRFRLGPSTVKVKLPPVK